MFDDMFDKPINVNTDCDCDKSGTACNGDCVCSDCHINPEMQDELDALDEEAEQELPF